MQEIGIESSILKQILRGRKTIECRLGKPKFLKLRVGDEVSLLEDLWQDGHIVRSIPGQATIQIKQLLYLETFEEALQSIDFTAAVPSCGSLDEALAKTGNSTPSKMNTSLASSQSYLRCDRNLYSCL